MKSKETKLLVLRLSPKEITTLLAALQFTKLPGYRAIVRRIEKLVAEATK